MPLNLALNTRPLFPCPLCGQGLDVRETKKDKPYIVCDPCGIQLFVRNSVGIARFRSLVASAEQRDIWQRLDDLQKRYRRKCPECGKEFWTAPDQIKTSWVDGRLTGYRCPEKGCSGVVAWTKEKR